MKRKVLAGFLTMVCVGSVILSGCGGGTTSADSGEKKENGAETSESAEEEIVETGEGDVTIAAWSTTADNLAEIAELFNAQDGHTGKVTVNKVDDSYTTILPALASGNGIPDMFQIQAREPAQFFLNYGTEAFVDLTDIIEPADEWVQHDVLNGLAEDGKYYAMPWSIGPCALFYRPDVFEECGIDIDTITTWDKYIEAGVTIREKTGMYMIATTENGTHCDELMMLLNEQGGQYYDADGNVNLNTEEMVKAVEIMKKLYDNDLVYECPDIWNDRLRAVSEEKVATIPYAVWYVGVMEAGCEDQANKWSVAPFPAFEEGGNNMVNMGGSSLVVSSTSKNIPLCKEFLTFAMKSDEGNEINLKWGQFPAYKPSYDGEYFEDTNEYFGGQNLSKFFGGYVDAPDIDYGPAFRDVQDQLKLATGELYKDGADVEAILENYSQKAQSIIDSKQ